MQPLSGTAWMGCGDGRTSVSPSTRAKSALIWFVAIAFNLVVLKDHRTRQA